MCKLYAAIDIFDPDSHQRVPKTVELTKEKVKEIQDINRQYEVSVLGKKLKALPAVCVRFHFLASFPSVSPFTDKSTQEIILGAGSRSLSKPEDQSGKLLKMTGSAQLSGPIPPPIGS